MRVAAGKERCLWCEGDFPEAFFASAANRVTIRRYLSGMDSDARAVALQFLPDSQRDRYAAPSGRNCVGLPGAPCDFALTLRGGPANRVTGGHCLFCSPAALASTCNTEAGRRDVVQKLCEMKPSSRNVAIEARVPPEHRAFFLRQDYAGRSGLIRGGARRLAALSWPCLGQGRAPAPAELNSIAAFPRASDTATH